MKYAAYGSNLHPLRLSRRLPSAELISSAYLPDWSLHFHKRSIDESGKCNIRRGGSGVHYAIFEISLEDKLALDRIEGVGPELATLIVATIAINQILGPVAFKQALTYVGETKKQRLSV